MTNGPKTRRVYLLTIGSDKERSATGTPEVIFQVGKSFTSIFRVSAIAFQPGGELNAKINSQLIALLSRSNCRLQFIHNRLPFDKEKFSTAHAWDFAFDEEYIKWASDYVRKWYSKVGDWMYEGHYHIVVSEADSALGNPLSRRRADFVKVCKAVGDKLNALEMQPQQLNEHEAQELISHNPVAAYHSEDIAAKITQGIFKAGYVASLPDEIADGWLTNLATICGVFAVSVTIEPVDNAEKEEIKERIEAAKKDLPSPLPPDLGRLYSGKEEPVKLSISYCASGANAASTNATFSQIESILKELGATCQSKVAAKTLSYQCLPLGQSAESRSHTISSSTAVLSLPITKIKGTNNLGTPLGSTLCSAEPVYLAMNAEGMDDLLVVASHEKDRSALLSLLSLRYLSTGNKVVYVGAGRSMSVPMRCLGANAHKIALKPQADLETASLPSSARLAFFSLEDLSELKDTNVELIINALGNMEKHTLLVIETASAFSETEELMSVINHARENEQTIILADSAKHLVDQSIPTGNFKNILAFAPAEGEAEEFEGTTGISEIHLLNFKFGQDSTLLYANFNGDCDVLHFITSPMEAFMLQFSHKPSKESNFEERLSEKIAEIKAKNPQLSDSDSVRQGVYYLGLQG